jgi:CRISPR-associated endonuclease/helicase Cas3
LAAELSGLPTHFRHEALSVQILQENPSLWHAHDPELLLHLIAAHHGHGRPFCPVCLDEDPPEVSLAHDGAVFKIAKQRRRAARPLHQLDSGCTERFWRLTRKYGYWGLAYLEAILRWAAHPEAGREENQTTLTEVAKEYQP